MCYKKARNSHENLATSFRGISFADILNSWDRERKDSGENTWEGWEREATADLKEEKQRIH